MSIQRCVSFCNEELTNHDLILCEAYIEGAIAEIIVGTCNSTLVDPSNGVEVLAEIAAGRAKLIRNVRVEIPLAAPALNDSPVGGGSQIASTYDRTITIFDANSTAANVIFWNNVKRLRAGYIIVKEYGANRITFIDPRNGVGIKFTGSRVIPGVKTEFQRFELIGAWSQYDESAILPAPAGVFS